LSARFSRRGAFAVVGSALAGFGLGRYVEPESPQFPRLTRTGSSFVAFGPGADGGAGFATTGSGLRYGASLSGTSAPVHLAPPGATTYGAPTRGTFAAGDVYVDSAGLAYICTASSPPARFEMLNNQAVDLRVFGARPGSGGSDAKPAFETVFSATGSASTTIVIADGSYLLSTNLEIPGNVSLKFENGGMLSPAAGTTVTITGPLEAGPVQIFQALGDRAGQGQVHLRSRLSSIHPEWWGAQPDDSDPSAAVDSAPAFQAMVDSLSQSWGKPRVALGTGRYRIGETISIRGSLGQTGFIIEGQQGSPWGPGNGTGLVWSGGAYVPMIQAHTAGLIIRGVVFEVVSGSTLLCAIDFDNDPPVAPPQKPAFYAQKLTIENCGFQGRRGPGNAGAMTYGIRIGNSSGAQLDTLRLVRCQFIGQDTASVYLPSNNSNTLFNKFDHCIFGYVPCAIYYRSGSLRLDSCGFYHVNSSQAGSAQAFLNGISTAIYIGTAFYGLEVFSSDEEDTDQFLYVPGPATGNIPVTIIGGRLSLRHGYGSGVLPPPTPDRCWLTHLAGGPLTLIGCTFPRDPNFKIRVEGVEGVVGRVTAIGCSLPNDQPTWSDLTRLTTINSRAWSSAALQSQPLDLPDRLDTTQTAALDSVPTNALPAATEAAIVRVSTNTELASLPGTILVDASSGDIILDLPQAGMSAGSCLFKRVDVSTHRVRIRACGGETIEGEASVPLSERATALIFSDGKEWWLGTSPG